MLNSSVSNLLATLALALTFLVGPTFACVCLDTGVAVRSITADCCKTPAAEQDVDGSGCGEGCEMTSEQADYAPATPATSPVPPPFEAVPAWRTPAPIEEATGVRPAPSAEPRPDAAEPHRCGVILLV